MAMFDSLVVLLRDYVNNAPPPVDQSTLFYKDRPEGPDYMPPFSLGNVAHCPGVATPIQGEDPFDFYLVIIDQVKSFTEEYTKDRSLFFAEDFDKYDFMGEMLADPMLLEGSSKIGFAQQATSQNLLKYRYQKSMCQEMWPGRTNEPYGKPFVQYEMLGEAELIEISHLEFRQEWRALMEETLGMKLKDGSVIPEIGTLDERKKAREDFEAEKQRQREEKNAERAKKMAEEEKNRKLQ